MQRIPHIILIISIFLIVACDIKNNDIDPASSFTKIYDDGRFEQEYYPLSVIQTSDEGYLILSEVKNDNSLFTSVFIVKVDKYGEKEQSTLMADPNGHPVAGWSEINGQYNFICMNTSTLEAQVVAVDMDGTVGLPMTITTVTYPLVSKQDGNNLMLLSFDNLAGESVFSIVGSDGIVIQQVSYSIGAGVDVEKPIIDHLTRNGPILPFSVGKIDGNSYFFNGLYNYTFSMVFTNFGDSPTGVCQGQLSSGGLSNALSLGGNSFAVARYNFGANYINQDVQISSSQTTSSVDLGGNNFPEIENGAAVSIRKHPDRQNILFGTHTTSRRLVFYSYNGNDGSLLGTDYIGSGNPYLFADMTFTTDGGLIILSQVALEDRFPRIALFKRDKGFLDKLF